MYKVNMFMDEDKMCMDKNKMYMDKINVCMQLGDKYATAYVIPQTYKNLFSINDAFENGTIFKDLYMPNYKCKKCNY